MELVFPYVAQAGPHFLATRLLPELLGFMARAECLLYYELPFWPKEYLIAEKIS